MGASLGLGATNLEASRIAGQFDRRRESDDLGQFARGDVDFEGD